LEGQYRFCALILIYTMRRYPITATSGNNIDQRLVPVIIAMEPRHGELGML
jgi:hypothetical protein